MPYLRIFQVWIATALLSVGLFGMPALAAGTTQTPARPHKVDDGMSTFGKRPAIDRANDSSADYKHVHKSIWSLRRFRADAAMCALRINELGKHPAEILLLWRHAEEHARGAHVPVEGLHVGNGEPQFDLSSRVLFGSRVQREGGFARHELAPARRLEHSNFTFRPSTSRWNFTALSMSATNLITYLSCVPCILLLLSTTEC